MNAIAIAIHVVAATIWVGGMFFAYMALRPVAAVLLEPQLRLPLWAQTLGRFFPWVWIVVIALPVSGYWLIFNIFGGFETAPIYIHAMNGIGTIMILLFIHVFFAPFQRLRRAVSGQDWPQGGQQLAQIRRMVGFNLLLGLVVVAIAGGGRYLI